MPKHFYDITSTILAYPGMGGWRFVALPKKEAVSIKETYGAHANGWGSLPVSVRIGKTTWETSIFPDKKSNTYLLPLKASVRKAEGIHDDSTVRCRITILITYT